jgi:hypothetical protein
MTPEEFVAALRITVFDASTSPNVIRPTGRSPHEMLIQLSGWYDSLDQYGQASVRQILRIGGYSTLFGVLAVLDGSRVIDDPPHGRLRLSYVGADGAEVTLNEPEVAELHALWSAEVFPFTEKM